MNMRKFAMRFIISMVWMNTWMSVYPQQRNWQNLDLNRDSCFGISTERAYREILYNKKPREVTVAVIDSGIDTLQEDLRPILWKNPKDGLHGWNYIGPESGEEDITRLVGSKRDFYDSLSLAVVPEDYRVGYQVYRRLLAPQLDAKIDAMQHLILELQDAEKLVDSIALRIGKAEPSVEDFKSYTCKNKDEQDVINQVTKKLMNYSSWKEYRWEEIERIIEIARFHLDHGLNYENRENDTSKGNGDISPDKLGLVKEANFTAYHGTHVAGIIGAVRGNGIGMDGVADNVRIMVLKVNGTIRELRDKSLADAIRYATDNGATVVNLSFGKPYSWDKVAVDEALKYAMKRDVIIVHAAGNSGENLDAQAHYPNPVFLDGSGSFNAWIEVGASGFKNDSNLCASFSNYGKIAVDVFAPGVAIYSTLPYNQYASWNGTSMATPMVAGLAALIREYYPRLTGAQIKDIILRSVVKSPFLSNKCKSGGVVNVFNALTLASSY